MNVLPPSIAVAIPTYRREAELVNTVNEVLGLSPMPAEILVIDQTPCHEPATQSVLERLAAQGRIRWIREDAPGLTRARNRALMACNCEAVLFLDDDVLLPQIDLVDRHRLLLADSTVKAVSGQVVGKAGGLVSLSHTEIARLGPLIPANVAAIHTKGIPMLRGGHHSVRVADAIRIGGYDERLTGPAFGEDLDFAMRLGGDSILTTSSCTVTHLTAPSGGCRVVGKGVQLSAAERMVPAFAVALRYGRCQPGLRRTWMWIGLRAGVVRRELTRRPWELALALAAVPVALVRARSVAASPPAAKV